VRDRLIYLNGSLVRDDSAHLSAMDRGFTLGDGVFDTLSAISGKLFRLTDHLERLVGAAGTIGLKMPVEKSALAGAIAAVLESNDLASALVRVTISRGIPVERGLLPPTNPSPCLAISAMPFGGYRRELFERGYRAAVSRIRRNETSPLSRIKSCNYLDSVLARMETSAQGAEEALLLNTAGNLACGASSNVFLVKDEVLVTPDLESGVLDGIVRRTVLELAAHLGLPSIQRPVRPEEVDEAQEVFVTNTAIGIVPVVALDGRAVGRESVRPVSTKLHRAFCDLVTHRD